MATLNDLVHQHASFTSAQRAHLRRLIGAWGLLADLSFSDLLLFARARAAGPEPHLVVLGQLRPATGQTLYVDDEVGKLIPLADRPLVAEAFEAVEIREEQIDLRILNRRVHITAVPVVHDGQVLAVLSRENRQLEDRIPSELEFTYLDVFRRLAQMIVDGAFPFPYEDVVTEETPRVGDGLLVLDADTRIRYSSPNGVSALHRAGYHGRIVDRRLEDVGFDSAMVESVYRLQAPIVQELERGDDVTILARIFPLNEGDRTTGALVLLRDVSDLRRRDRMLVSMDATIREIHHRVKNNLQTVSSLLRIQGRRMDSSEAKAAVDEAVRRIQSIAIIHEMLAASGGDRVAFQDVVLPIMQMAETGLVSGDRPIRFRLVGEGPELSASRASSLAVVVNELIQNAIEHGFPPGCDGGAITVELLTGASDLRVRVHDDGVGVPEGFDPADSDGLGLTIISTLVSGELDGVLKIRPATAPQPGTVAEVRVSIVEAD
jgi:two-component sensor histidine kinase